MTGISAAVFTLQAIACAGCADSSGHAPTARILITPGYVVHNDDFQTDVVLDATASRDDLDDPHNATPLLYDWTVADPGARIAPDLNSAKITVRIDGSRPVTVRLAVSDGALEGHAMAQIGLTLP